MVEVCNIDIVGTLEEIKILFLNTLYLCTAVYVSPLILDHGGSVQT